MLQACFPELGLKPDKLSMSSSAVIVPAGIVRFAVQRPDDAMLAVDQVMMCAMNTISKCHLYDFSGYPHAIPVYVPKTHSNA
jgi:hypothetical protein